MKKMLNGMTVEGLAGLIEEKPALFCKLREVVDYIIQYDLDDLFRSAPRGLDYEIDGYRDFVEVNLYRVSYSDCLDIVRWMDEKGREYGLYTTEYPDFSADAEKAEKYLRVLANGVAKTKDEEFMEHFVTGFFEKACDCVLQMAKSVLNQYDDPRDIAEELIDGDHLDGYYLDDDGCIYEERRPLKIA